jgi:hemerythrin-like metal-binding protein
MTIEWNDKYRIGDKAIDDEHIELFRIAARFLAATTKDSRQNSAMELRLYTQEHFGHEEVLMHDVSYPFTATHLRQHEELIGKLRSIEEKLAKGTLFKSELEEFINYWLVKHMAAVDAPLVVYVKKYKASN